MAISVTCQLSVYNSSRTRVIDSVIYFTLDNNKYYRYAQPIQPLATFTFEHTFYNLNDYEDYIIYACNDKFDIIDTAILNFSESVVYSELTQTTTMGNVVSSITVTNNFSIDYEVSVFFQLNDDGLNIVTQTIPRNSSLVFTQQYDIDSEIENTVSVYKYNLDLLDTVTTDIVPIIIFTYSNFTATYADDIDYNDVITCSLTATNTTTSNQICNVYFEFGNYLIHKSFTIPASSSHVFTCTFDCVDIFIANIINFYDEEFQLINSTTVLATPEFEMFFEVTDIMKTLTIQLAITESSEENIFWGDGLNNLIYSTALNTTLSFSHTYTENGIYRISFSDFRKISGLLIGNQLVSTNYNRITINPNEISKLRNLNILSLYYTTNRSTTSSQYNITLVDRDLKKLKNLRMLQLSRILNLTISPNTISQISNLYQLYIAHQLGVEFSDIELENMKYIGSGFVIQSVGKTEYNSQQLKVYDVNCSKQAVNSALLAIGVDCSQLNLTTLALGNSNNINFNNSNLTSETCDRILYLATLSGATSGKYVNIAGATNSKRTHASDADKATLLANGWVVTDNGVI